MNLHISLVSVCSPSRAVTFCCVNTDDPLTFYRVFLVNCRSGLPAVGAAVQSAQSAAEQGLSAAMATMQVGARVNPAVEVARAACAALAVCCAFKLRAKL